MQALSPTDSAFLWMETRNQPMHVAGLNIFTPPPDSGTDFVAKLLADWAKHMKAIAPFNLRPVLRMGLWYWEEDEEFELDYHLRHLALPQPGRIRELLAMVSRLHGNLLDRNRPLWETYVIEGLPGGRFATYSKIHHALVDGVSGARMAANAMSDDASGRKAPVWDMPFPHHPASSGKRTAPTLMQQIGNVAKAGRDILPGIGSGLWDIARASYVEGAAALPFQAPPTPFNVEISGSRRFASQSYSLARLKHIGEATGATVNDVTLAICAGALREYLQAQNKLPKKPLVAMVPVSLHGETSAGGNQVSLLLASLATDIADPLKRLKRIVESTSQAKQRLTKMPRLQKMAHGITSISPLARAWSRALRKNIRCSTWSFPMYRAPKRHCTSMARALMRSTRYRFPPTTWRSTSPSAGMATGWVLATLRAAVRCQPCSACWTTPTTPSWHWRPQSAFTTARRQRPKAATRRVRAGQGNRSSSCQEIGQKEACCSTG
ncbi:MAG: wax ester/triacylglycerol synthase family O-acyltransferase [Burkholderiales bacterium]|nr:wax ester/triacylglycerol synthase family O-acyltransferase [Burkholderiales bacterium]